MPNEKEKIICSIRDGIKSKKHWNLWKIGLVGMVFGIMVLGNVGSVSAYCEDIAVDVQDFCWERKPYTYNPDPHYSYPSCDEICARVKGYCLRATFVGGKEISCDYVNACPSLAPQCRCCDIENKIADEPIYNKGPYKDYPYSVRISSLPDYPIRYIVKDVPDYKVEIEVSETVTEGFWPEDYKIFTIYQGDLYSSLDPTIPYREIEIFEPPSVETPPSGGRSWAGWVIPSGKEWWEEQWKNGNRHRLLTYPDKIEVTTDFTLFINGEKKEKLKLIHTITATTTKEVTLIELRDDNDYDITYPNGATEISNTNPLFSIAPTHAYYERVLSEKFCGGDFLVHALVYCKDYNKWENYKYLKNSDCNPTKWKVECTNYDIPIYSLPYLNSGIFLGYNCYNNNENIRSFVHLGYTNAYSVCASLPEPIESSAGQLLIEKRYNLSDRRIKTSLTIAFRTEPPACTAVGLSNPTITSSSPEEHTDFTITCPTGVSDVDCVYAYADGDSEECSFDKWDGNKAIFNCSGLDAGDYTAKCKAVTGTGSNCCAEEKSKSYTIKSDVLPVLDCSQQDGICCSGDQICKGGEFTNSADCGTLCCIGGGKCDTLEVPPSPSTVSLFKGWNIISSPIETPLSLSKIEESCSLTTYEGHKIYAFDPVDQEWTYPSQITNSEGVYVLAENDCTIPVSGNSAVLGSKSLTNGWNLISAETSLDKVKGDCKFISEPVIWERDAKNKKWVHPGLTDNLNQGKGYWVAVDNNCTLNKEEISPPPIPYQLWEGVKDFFGSIIDWFRGR